MVRLRECVRIVWVKLSSWELGLVGSRRMHCNLKISFIKSASISHSSYLIFWSKKCFFLLCIPGFGGQRIWGLETWRHLDLEAFELWGAVHKLSMDDAFGSFVLWRIKERYLFIYRSSYFIFHYLFNHFVLCLRIKKLTNSSWKAYCCRCDYLELTIVEDVLQYYVFLFLSDPSPIIGNACH